MKKKKCYGKHRFANTTHISTGAPIFNRPKTCIWNTILKNGETVGNQMAAAERQKERTLRYSDTAQANRKCL